MLNRILILFGNELDKNNLLKTGQYLKEKYGTEVYGLYIRDIRKYEVLPPTVEGLVVDNSANFLIREWEKSENIQVEELKKVFKNYFPVEHLLIEEGITQEIVQEKMLGFDLVIVEKSKTITANQKDILRHHYKPVLLISEKNNLKIEKVMIANDKSERVNKSIFAFLNMFHKLDDFTSVAVNLEDETDDEFSKYMEIAGKTLNSLELEGKPIDIISEKSEEFDILIMGDLKHSFLLEKLTGNTGLKLLENIEIPIYIG
ncbi:MULTISPECIES: hypothetical protein [Psychrilyobacter]|uniref:Universal stress protein family protein n=1 Tax=Psychrilyobacter piezotolerans TaxID=2293438 RepID=A0ABX9KHG2_9FUSO|nr:MULTISPECIES: hypothetical protein [Psychrilyobacter]MCS5421164.1 hypothetical protein [Psychrilyobacter sp. S5]NDI77921.1 hypothetical protein [Psychrilyobacter piezotolerans]RDE62038.1 hypothetical protein DV867_07585 [Psychrilyobacter sp. S5]REI41285.1 hypothetical protein DYH56_07585 [Psychrilyobacter piezotolerans]